MEITMKLSKTIYTLPQITRYNFGFNLDKLKASLEPISTPYIAKTNRSWIKGIPDRIIWDGANQMFSAILASRLPHYMVFNAFVAFGSKMREATIVTPMMDAYCDPIIVPRLIGRYYLARPIMLKAMSVTEALYLDANYNCPDYKRHDSRLLIHDPDSADHTQFRRIIKLDPTD